MTTGMKTTLSKLDRNMGTGPGTGTGLRWHSPDLAPFQIAGFAWLKKDKVYRRMPLNPDWKLPDAVNWLANNTAGGQIRFRTDSTTVAVRVELDGRADMNHMPSTGQCGFDLYIGPPGKLRFCSTTKYDISSTSYEVQLMQGARREWRNILLNFPLYRGVKKVMVGLDHDAGVRAPPPFSGKPVVIYGTSVTQGGCASRPGMAFTNILSRELNVEFINLGFSGSGKGEPEVARIISGIRNVSLFILDYEANCVSTEQLNKTMPEFIRILRAAHRKTPILVVSRIAFARDIHDAATLKQRRERTAVQKRAVAAAAKNGDNGIFFFDGSRLLGSDFDECTVDGVHPTDLGFRRIAKGLKPAIARLLKHKT